MRILTALFCIALLAGCLDEASEPVDIGQTPDDETTDRFQPAQGNAKLYLHSEGQRTWMDTDPEATQGAIGGTWTALDPMPWHRFVLEPTTQMDLVLTGPITVDVQAFAPTLLDDTDILVRLVVAGDQVSEQTANSGRAVLEAPERIANGTSVAIEVCVCPTMTSLFYSYQIATDGASVVTLPLSSPVFAGANGTGSDGAIETGQTPDGRWFARQTSAFAGTLGGAERVDLALSTVNGAIDVSPRESGYEVHVMKEGRGDTEQEARENLKAIAVDHEDRVQDRTMHLATIVTTDDGRWEDRMASIDAAVAAVPLRVLDAKTTNGGVDVSGHEGGAWTVKTSNGAIEVEGSSESMQLRTTNGAVDVEGSVDTLEVVTTNARVTLDVQATRSGTWTVSTANGQIRLAAPEGDERGYDIQGTTTNGLVTFSFEHTDAVGQQTDTHKHERTHDYNARAVQTKVDLQTTNGAIQAGP